MLTASQLNNDVHLETQRSNFSILLKADFEIKHDYQFVMLSFTEPAMAPPELLIWINGDSMSTFIEDKFLIGALPNLAANTSFRLDISNYINNPIGIDILCYITIYAFMEDDTYIPIVAQNLLTLVASQSMDEMENILLIENANNAIYSFDSVNLEIIFKTNDIVPQKNEILRLILPLDFPPNYYIAESLVTCFLTLIDLNLNISSTCIMRGINIDLTINQNLGLTDFSGLRFLFVVSNIYSTPNFGYSGNFGLILFNILYKIRATNFKVWDYYTNPIVIQDLNSILVTLSEDSTNYEVSVEMKKGTNITIFLKTDEIVINLNILIF